MKKPISRYAVVCVLVLLFAAPGLFAYLCYQHPQWLGASRINKGLLLEKPIALSSAISKDKWQIIFWSPQGCDEHCIAQLDLLSRVRLALGRKLYQVDQWLVVNEQTPTLPNELHELLKKQDYHSGQLIQAEQKQLALLPADTKVFIVTPDNYVILGYKVPVNPDDVYKDLKLLLNVEQKNG